MTNPILDIPNIDPKIQREILDNLAQAEDLLRSHIIGKYPLVIETSRHLVEAGGKRFRPLITLICSYLGTPNNNVIKAAVTCELTHLATLYHDDVMDEAPLRRGVTSANSRWGNTVAILTGDYLFAKVSALLAELGPEAVLLQALTFERLVIGQILETQGPKDGVDPLDHYLNVVADKTGSLIAASARFGAMLSGASEKDKEIVTQFGEKIGIAFQLADDVIDISSSSNESGKTPGTDLREGVPTLVTLKVMQSKNPQDFPLQQKLAHPITDDREVERTLHELRNHQALIDARQYLHALADEAKNLLEDLSDGPTKIALAGLCTALVDRTA